MWAAVFNVLSTTLATASSKLTVLGARLSRSAQVFLIESVIVGHVVALAPAGSGLERIFGLWEIQGMWATTGDPLRRSQPLRWEEPNLYALIESLCNAL